MTDAHRPSDGPDEPAQPPDGPASPSMPPDPFTAADVGYAMIVASFRGLRKAGARLIEAALITAAHVVITGIASEAKKPPEN